MSSPDKWYLYFIMIWPGTTTGLYWQKLPRHDAVGFLFGRESDIIYMRQTSGLLPREFAGKAFVLPAAEWRSV